MAGLCVLPKIDTNNCRNIGPELDFLIGYAGVEVQLLSEDLVAEAESVMNLLAVYPNLRYVCLHMPFSLVNLGFVMCCSVHSLAVNTLLDYLLTMSADSGVEFDVLFHLRTVISEFCALGGEDYLLCLDEKVSGSKVSLILENSVMPLTCPMDKADTINYLFSKRSFSNIFACLDICHLRLSERIWGTSLNFSPGYLAAIRNIHFSYVDTSYLYFKDMGHSDPHPSLSSVIEDMAYIKSRGLLLEDLRFVLEVTERDYVNRPNLKYEIRLLEGYLNRSAM